MRKETKTNGYNYTNRFDNVNPKQFANIKKEIPECWINRKSVGGGYYGQKTLPELYHLLYKIHPARYVWHVTPKKNRESIARDGIICGMRREGGLWANNHNIVSQFYPWAIDGPFGGEPNYENYDFWRIDTLKARVEWKMDPYMHVWASEHKAAWEERKRFICTLKNISRSAISLFAFERTFYSDEQWKYRELYLESVSTHRLVPVRI